MIVELELAIAGGAACLFMLAVCAMIACYRLGSLVALMEELLDFQAQAAKRDHARILARIPRG